MNVLTATEQRLQSVKFYSEEKEKVYLYALLFKRDKKNKTFRLSRSIFAQD